MKVKVKQKCASSLILEVIDDIQVAQSIDETVNIIKIQNEKK